MDTLSPEPSSNGSYLPVASIIVGAIGLVLSVVALIKVSDVRKGMAELTDSAGRVEAIQNDVRAAVEKSDEANKRVADLTAQTQRAFDQVAADLAGIRTRAESAAKESAKPAAAVASGSGGPAPAAAIAADGTYVVVGGDTGTKIARALNIKLDDLMAANSDVDWNRLQVGQKLNVPKQ